MTDPWVALRRFTQARIALGRAGHALPTEALLDFQLAHAQARDAVHWPWDLEAFAEGAYALGAQTILLSTPVSDRGQYLRRPDLGRILEDSSRDRLRELAVTKPDIVLVITNGLSSTAVERHGLGLLKAILAGYASCGLRLSPICLVANGRVALGDDIGNTLGARVAVIVVGERPGLSAADSLGIYLTYGPRPGNTDAQRNCISNVRPPEGLGYEPAAAKLLYLTQESIRRQISGVSLKDEMAGGLLSP